MNQSEQPKPKSKKWLWIGGSIVGLFLLGRLGSGDANDKDSGADSVTTVSKSEESIPLASQMKNLVTSAKEFKPTTKYTDYTEMVVQLAVFKSWSTKIREAEAGGDQVAKEQAKVLKRLTASIQSKEFPKMRAAYIKLLKEKLWENDVTVEKVGKSTIRFTGGMFAANKNIKQFHTTVYDQIEPLRFSQAQYRWYSGDEEYTYYKLTPPKDSELLN